MKMKMLALAFSALAAQSALAAGEVNVYSNRQDELIKPIIQQFEKESGIKVNVVFAKEGLNERLEREGKLSPADLMLTVDISRLTDLVDKGLVQPVDSKILQENIPAIYRDPENRWFALTTRVSRHLLQQGAPRQARYHQLRRSGQTGIQRENLHPQRQA